MEAYLDNAATTKVFPSVAEIMMKVMEEDYGNPSSMHQKGINAERYINEAKDVISKSLKVEQKELIFTSGGTESNNMAVIGSALANSRTGKHIITTAIEHPSVSSPLKVLEEQGFEISYLPVDKNGQISMENLEDELREDTMLVTIIYVNNEIGSVQNIKDISDTIKKSESKAILHVDAVQAYGKYKIYPKRLGIDLMSISGHKIHGPKGIGVLYVKDKIKLKPLIFGGGQQKDLRSGTENVPAIAGLAEAVRKMYQNHGETIQKLEKLKRQFVEGVLQLEEVFVNAADEEAGSAPHIASVSFAGIKSEVMLHSLEGKGIYASAGSACSSNHPQLSTTLYAAGVKQELLDATLRFSFSVNTTSEEIEYTIQTLKELVPALRRFRKR